MRLSIIYIALLLLIPEFTGCTQKAEAAKSLEGRLFCAARSAYGIVPKRPFRKEAGAYDGAGWVKAPDLVQGGPGAIHACLVGETQDGIVVAFRGTLPPKEVTQQVFLDWLNNFWHAAPAPWQNMPGKYHPGYSSAIDDMWKEIMSHADALNQGGTKKVYFTGHSKGGALAQLAALRFRAEKGTAPAAVFTFGAPKCMDETAVSHAQGLSITRYEHALDIVPWLAPDGSFINMCQVIPGVGESFADAMDWEYEDAGQALHISKGGQVEKPGIMSGISDAAAMVHTLSAGVEGFRKLVEGHESGCGKGYWSALCPEIKCSTSPTP